MEKFRAEDSSIRGVEGQFDRLASIDTGDVLRATKAPPDIRPAEGGRVDYALPNGTFLGGTGPLNLVATQVDGRPLPNWLTFDAAKGVFKGVAPADVRGTIEIRVIARDTNGQKAEVVVKLRVGSDNRVAMMEKNGMIGKRSLSEQIIEAIEKMKAAA